MRAPSVLARLDWWVLLAAAAVAIVGCAFIRSATLDDPDYERLYVKQVVLLTIAAGSGLGLVLIPYQRVLRWAWAWYAMGVLALLGLRLFGTVINGSQRWYSLPGFSVQPSEFAKLATIVALASFLRFRNKTGLSDGLFVPLVIAAVPAVLVLRQPDLGSALVFGPVLLAMCFVAGTPTRSLLWLLAISAVVSLAAYFVLHDYQRERIDVWLEHFSWQEGEERSSSEVRAAILGSGYQPWQSLIAIGSGGLLGFGFGEGPQNRYGFLPYNFDDYIFSVVAEESGLFGACGLLLLQALLVLGLLGIALRTRERFGRLIAVGVATYFATQTLVHIAVCTWLIPATGLPMPLVSYGGSSVMVSMWAVALVLNVGARQEHVLAPDGFG